MREIKFRAWDNKNKEFVCAVPSLEVLLDDPDAPVSHHDYSEEEAIYFCPNYPMGPTFNGRIEYEQYTGQKDKNKREIYEGDIVVFYKNEGRSKCIEEVHYLVDEGNLYPRVEDCCVLGNKSEVIGNIHENPELLN